MALLCVTIDESDKELSFDQEYLKLDVCLWYIERIEILGRLSLKTYVVGFGPK